MAAKSLELFPAPQVCCAGCGVQAGLLAVMVYVYKPGSKEERRLVSSPAFRVCPACALGWSRRNPRPGLRSAFRAALQGLFRRIGAVPVG